MGNEIDSDISVEDSDVEKSNEEILCLPIPDIERPPSSKDLDKLLSGGEFDMDDEQEDDILKESFFKRSEKSGPAIDKLTCLQGHTK